MIRGVVNDNREGIIRLRVRGPAGTVLEVDAIVDSGFVSSLTLPITTVSALDLVRQSGSSGVLADGSIRQFDVYHADVEWDGAWRTVLVSALGNEPLLGMRLMSRHKLTIEVVPRGLVEIVPLP